MNGIDPQTINVKVAHPHQGIVAKEAPHLVRTRFVEVYSSAPGCLVCVRKVGSEFAGVISGRTKVVVHHVKKHGQTSSMSRVDKTLQGIRASVGFVHRKKRNSVVPPSMVSVKGCNGHQFNMGDAEFGQVVEPSDG